MLADERRGRLLELVRHRGFASLLELAEQMDVSESTVRRDLDFLEESGEAQRTHGGAFYIGPSPKLPHFEQRHKASWSQKRMIAARAVQLIEDGDTVLLDGGTTTYELAQMLVDRPLQIVTNSLPVASLFTSSPNTDLVILGGYVHSRTGVSLGPYTNTMIADLNVRRAVISVAGVTRRGYFNSNLLLVETERAMMQAADEVIVVADSTKFGHQSLTRLCDLGGIDKLVVDDGLSDTWRQVLDEVNVTYYLAEDQQAATSTPRRKTRANDEQHQEDQAAC